MFLFALSLDSTLIKWEKGGMALDSLIYIYTESESPYTTDYTIALFIRNILMNTGSIDKPKVEKGIFRNYMGKCTERLLVDDGLNVLSVICNAKKGFIGRAESIYRGIKEKTMKSWAAYFIAEYVKDKDVKKAMKLYQESILICPSCTVSIFARDRLFSLKNSHG